VSKASIKFLLKNIHLLFYHLNLLRFFSFLVHGSKYFFGALTSTSSNVIFIKVFCENFIAIGSGVAGTLRGLCILNRKSGERIMNSNGML